MTLSEYQKEAQKTAIYPNVGNNFVYPVLGLCGEVGEVAEKVKKIFRDNEGVLDESKKQEIKKELGDVLWYVSQISTEMGLSLDEVASFNVEKLRSRQERAAIHGDGDNR
ncbi:MAG: putative pyrophosphatase [Parcubacteria group bacterium GW2011_GWA2_39_18]|nr:MAG: putative pyrophosphatase [Parcubacteria group bacterium GW2011_GWA2_39_18]